MYFCGLSVLGKRENYGCVFDSSVDSLFLCLSGLHDADKVVAEGFGCHAEV